MTGHTKEPWAVSKHGDIQAGKSADGDDLVAIRVMGSVRQSQYEVPNRVTRLANLHRAVDCVNALAGIENPAALGALIEAVEGAAKLIDRAADWIDKDPGPRGPAEEAAHSRLIRSLDDGLGSIRTALANLRGGAQ